MFVTIYDAPHELPDSAIEYRLSKYGQIFSSRRGKVPGYPDVFNGPRHLRMELNTHVLCFLRFGKFQIRVKYKYSGDDDDMGDSVPLRDGLELATAWKRISRKKGRKKNLARKASSAASDLFVLVRKATRPSLPGARPRKGKD